VLREIGGALGLATQAVQRDPGELAGQMFGRLVPEGRPGSVLAGAAQRAGPWLRPVRPSLTAPGGPLLAEIPGQDPMALSPDGRLLVCGPPDMTFRDPTLQVVDLASLSVVARLEGHEQRVTCAAFLSDSRRCLSACKDGVLRLWDVRSARCLRVYEGHTDEVTTLDVSPGGRVASGSRDGWVLAWDLDEGTFRRIPVDEERAEELSRRTALQSGTRGPGDVEVVRWLDTDRLLVGWYSASATVWMLNRDRVDPVGDQVLDAAVAPDGGTMLVAAGAAAAVSRVTRWALPGLLMTGNVVRSQAPLAFAPDGRTFVTGADPRLVRVWDTDTEQQVAEFSGHDMEVLEVAVTPDGRRVISAGDDERVRIWDPRAEVSDPAGGHRDVIFSLEIIDDQVAVTGSRDNTVRRWSLRDGVPMGDPIGHGAWVMAIRRVPGASRFITHSGSYRLFDAEAGELLTELDEAGSSRSVAFDPAGGVAFVDAGDRVLRWDLSAGGAEVFVADLGARIAGLWPAGDQLVVVFDTSSRDDNVPVAVFDRRTAALVASPSGGARRVVGFAGFPAGDRFATCDATGLIRVWDTSQWEPVLEVGTGEGARLVASPDGVVLAAATGSHIVLFDTGTGRAIGHHSAIGSTGVRFSADGQYLVLSDREQRLISLWEVATGRVVCGFSTDAFVEHVQVAADGAIVVADHAGDLHVLRPEHVGLGPALVAAAPGPGGSRFLCPHENRWRDLPASGDPVTCPGCSAVVEVVAA
jgi:WD40 repeat protein